jgi:hypothetical protein
VKGNEQVKDVDCDTHCVVLNDTTLGTVAPCVVPVIWSTDADPEEMTR